VALLSSAADCSDSGIKDKAKAVAFSLSKALLSLPRLEEVITELPSSSNNS
jgi:hypothetical protein